MADLVAGALLSASFQVLFERLSSPLVLNFFQTQSRTHHDNDGDRLLKKLKLKLLGLNVVLNDAEKQQFTNQSVKDWMDELKDAVYHADDLLDEIATKALGFKVEAEYRRSISNNQVRASISTSTSTCSLFDAELVSKMEEIIDRLEYFAKQKDILGLKEVVGQKWSHSHRLPSTCSVDESTVYGRDNDKEELFKLLLSDSGNKIDVIAIVGMGGLGKTTLAQLVYNDGRVVEHFDIKAWVCVSDEFDVFCVTKTILVAITSSNNYDTLDLNLLQVKLKEILMGKKFLIVLDDVWNENSSYWEILWTTFTVGAYGSKIIATTRNHSVASIMQTVPTRHLQHLSDGDCWSLFAKIVFDKGDSKAYPELEKIGKQIVDRCKGLPLATKALAGLARLKLDVEEWDEILKSDIWDLPENKINILPALRLSYHYLPSHLKQCFAFCSTFPKDYEFEKEGLVLFWIAQNFVQQPRKNKTLEKMGEEYFHELLSRSFFQQASDNESLFVMHDLVHDLAQVVHGQFSFRLDDKNLLDISPKARHFSYVRGEYDDFEKLKAINEVKCLRSFLPLKSQYGHSYLTKKVLENIYSTQRCLRLLTLQCYRIWDLHDSIGNLIYLRYLDLSKTKIEKLPEIVCDLYNLQTLLLSNCSLLTTLPVEMGKLICLRHLDISGTNLKEMPMQMSRLKGLQRLTAFVVGKCSGSGINELKEFHHLRGTLTISSLQNVRSGRDALEAKLKEKKQLEELVLEWSSASDNSQTEREVLDNLQPHTNLKRLSIKQYGGTRFPEWLGDHSYSNIVFLCLDKCDYCFSLPPLGQLPSLKHLNIARMNGITTVGEEFYGNGSSTKPFQSLETLRFEEMLEWEEWHIFEVEVFSQLQEFSVIKCPKLVGSLPKDMPSWVKLEIRDCSALMASLPRTCAADNLVLEGCDGVELGWQAVSSSLVKLEISDMASLKELTPELYTLTNLQEFFIRNCPSLLSFPQTGLPPKLTRLKVESCKALHSVTMSLNTCLQTLSISNCSSLALDGLPPSLKEVFISRSPKIVFPLSEEMGRCYTSLERLIVSGRDCLMSLSLGLFPKLRDISIYDCENFERLSIPNEHGLENLASLESISIIGCNSMVSCVQEALHAPNLKYFWVSNCRELKSLPEGMHSHFPSLESLWMWNCPEIESFPEGGLPSNLHLLWIEGCEKLVACRREWGLQRLPSLTHFGFFGGGGENEEDENVVESMLEEGLLPSTLTSISIGSLQNLKSLNYIGFQLLSSLERLEVFDCHQLQSLPEEGLLTSLSRLEISDCPLLEARCQSDRGAEWHKIAHIPFIIINYELIS